MQRIIIIIILIIVALAAYLFLEKPDHQVHSSDPTSENEFSSSDTLTPTANDPDFSSSDEQTPTADDADERKLAQEKTRTVIQSLTQSTKDTVLNIAKADNFVTGDQLLELPSMRTEEAKVETIQTAQVVVNEGTTSKAIDIKPNFAPSASSNDPVIKLMANDQMVANEALSPGDKIRLKELLSNPDIAKGTVFYIHAVTPSDMQGLWGILQRGLTNNFREGITLNDPSGTKLIADIPELADERLENLRSSFLGEFLYGKVNDIYIYNYQQGMLGQDPNMIKPGQQLVIVSYSEKELIEIYRHFTQTNS